MKYYVQKITDDKFNLIKIKGFVDKMRLPFLMGCGEEITEVEYKKLFLRAKPIQSHLGHSKTDKQETWRAEGIGNVDEILGRHIVSMYDRTQKEKV